MAHEQCGQWPLSCSMDRTAAAVHAQHLNTILSEVPNHLRPLLQAIAGSLQSLCWASSAVGGVVSAYFSGALIESYGTRGVFALTAVFPLIVSLSAALISEAPVRQRAPRPTDGMLGELIILVLADWITKHSQGSQVSRQWSPAKKVHESANCTQKPEMFSIAVVQNIADQYSLDIHEGWDTMTDVSL